MKVTHDLKQLEPLYNKKVECLCCSSVFSTKKIRSRYVKPQRVESDFGPVFGQKDYSPLYYYVLSCPHCGFSFTEDFSPLVSQAAKEKISREITSKMDKNIDYCGERDSSQAIKTYMLAIYCAELVKEKPIVFAHLCLRLAWIFRTQNKESEEQRFLSLALSKYEEAFINSEFNPERTPELQILYMIGELNRRLGKYQEAVKYFSIITEHDDGSRYTKYVNLARQQWRLAVEEFREKKKEE